MGTPGLCRHALGGECYIGPVGSAGGTFSIRFRDLPPAACVEMVTLDFSSFNINIYINAANNIAIGSSTCTTKDGETSCKYAVSRTIEQAAAECRGKLNTVSYIIHK